MALPRLLWLGCLLALAAWQAFAGLPGVSLLVLAAGAPLLALPRRSGPGWLAAGLGAGARACRLGGRFSGAGRPALELARARCTGRARLLVAGAGRVAAAAQTVARPTSGLPPRAAWESSIRRAATHVIAPTFTVELLLGAAVWALASAILPWLVRGRSAALDVGAARPLDDRVACRGAAARTGAARARKPAKSAWRAAWSGARLRAGDLRARFARPCLSRQLLRTLPSHAALRVGIEMRATLDAPGASRGQAEVLLSRCP